MEERGRRLEDPQAHPTGTEGTVPGDLSNQGLVLCPHSPCQVHTWSRPRGGPSWSCKSRGCQDGCTTAACRGRRSGTGREHQQLARVPPTVGNPVGAPLAPRVLLDSCGARHSLAACDRPMWLVGGQASHDVGAMRTLNVQLQTLSPYRLLGFPNLPSWAAAPLMDPGQAAGSQCAWHEGWVGIPLAQAVVVGGQEGLLL